MPCIANSDPDGSDLQLPLINTEALVLVPASRRPLYGGLTLSERQLQEGLMNLRQ